MIQTNVDRNRNSGAGGPSVLARKWFYGLSNKHEQEITAKLKGRREWYKKQSCRNIVLKIATVCLKATMQGRKRSCMRKRAHYQECTLLREKANKKGRKKECKSYYSANYISVT